MYCDKCKKEQETITIAGKTYCASCSTVLNEKKIPSEDLPKHKTPKPEATANGIKTEYPENYRQKIDPELKNYAKTLPVTPDQKDELEGSAILLDILKDNAKEKTDEKTLNQDKNLEEASDAVLDILSSPGQERPKEKRSFTPKPNGIAMNDIRPNDQLRNKEHLQKKHKEILRSAEDEIKDEAEQFARIVSSQSGYTREYDMMIMTIAIAALAAIVMAIYLTFK